jgi:hypothetical protein
MRPSSSASVENIMATAHLAPDPDVDFAFPLADPRAFAAFFAEQGYVVLRDAVPKDRVHRL